MTVLCDLIGISFHLHWRFLQHTEKTKLCMEEVQVSVSSPFPPFNATYLQVRDSIAFPQSDLENLQGANESCKSCQALLATSTYTNQQDVSSGGF